MKVILLQNVKRLGQVSSVVEVKRGYFRNYLYPLGKAIIYSKKNMEFFETLKDSFLSKAKERLSRDEYLYAKIHDKEIDFVYSQVNHLGHLYGAIRNHHIAHHINNLYGTDLKSDEIENNEVIKSLGRYNFSIVLHSHDNCKVTLNVISSQRDKNENSDEKDK